MTRKHRITLTVSFVLLVGCVLALRNVIEGRNAKKRQVQYQAALESYSDAMKPGSSRRDVEFYLHQRKLPFQQLCCVRERRSAYADLLKVGEEKVPWFCNKNNTYVALEFEATEPHGEIPEAHDSDRLISTTLWPHLEECL